MALINFISIVGFGSNTYLQLDPDEFKGYLDTLIGETKKVINFMFNS